MPESHWHQIQYIAWSALLVCRSCSTSHCRDLQASKQDPSGTASICRVAGPALTQQCSNQLLHGYFHICSLTAHKGVGASRAHGFVDENAGQKPQKRSAAPIATGTANCISCSEPKSAHQNVVCSTKSSWA